MRDAAMVEDEFDRPGDAGDEVEIGRRARKEAGGDTPRYRARPEDRASRPGRRAGRCLLKR